MPSTEETLAKLAGAKIVTKLDANSGFWQRKLSDSCKLLTTFSLGKVLFQQTTFWYIVCPGAFPKGHEQHFRRIAWTIRAGLYLSSYD